MTVFVENGKFEHFLCLFYSKVASRVENPEKRDAEIPCSAGAATLEAFEDGGKILLTIETDTDRDIDFRVQYVLFFQLLHETVGD